MARRNRTIRKATRTGLGLAVLGVIAGVAPPARGIDFVLVNEVPAGLGPSFDPDGTELLTLAQHAADAWSSVIQDTHTITLRLRWQDISGSGLSLSVPTASTGDRVDEALLIFDTQTAGGDPRQWFIDPTPLSDSEYNVSQTLFRDLNATNRNAWYNGTAPGLFEAGFAGNTKVTAPVVAKIGFDLLSSAIHEVGSVLGVPPVDPTNTELLDGDYDTDPVFLGGTSVGVKNLGDGLANTQASLNDFLEVGKRRKISATDVFAAAATSGWTQIDLPRKDFLVGTDWNTAGNWQGNAVPDDDSLTHVRHGGAVSMSADGQSGDLIITDGSSVDTGSNTLTVTAATTVSNNARLTASAGGGLTTDSLELDPTQTDGGLTLAGGTVTVNQGLTITSTQGVDGFGSLVVGGPLDNQGSIHANTGTLTLATTGAGTIDLDGSTEAGAVEVGSGGHLQIDALLTDDLDNDLTVSSQGTATFNQPWVANGTMNLNDGTLAGTGPATINGSVNVTGASAIASPVIFSGTASVAVNSDLDLQGATTYNGGSYTGTGTIAQTGDAAFATDTTISVGAFDLDGLADSSTVTLQANTTVTLNVDSIDPVDGSFDGTLDLNSGSHLVVNTASPWAISGATTLNAVTISGSALTNDGSISGTGTIAADVTNNGTIAGGSGTLRFDGIVTGTGAGFSGDRIQFGPTGGFTGAGTIDARINGQAGSTITATGDLTLGDAASTSGFSMQGVLDVGSHTVTLLDANAATLGSETILNGGTLLSPVLRMALGTGDVLSGTGTVGNELKTNDGTIAGGPGTLRFDGLVIGAGAGFSGDRILFGSTGGFTGAGTIDARIAGQAGSTITATGDLTLGNAASTSGFSMQGVLDVGSHTVTLLDANAATLGSETILNGGTLLSPVLRMALGTGDVLSGTGTVGNDLKTNNGTIAGGPGTLRFDGIVMGSGAGFTGDTIEFGSMGGFAGDGAVVAKIINEPGAVITATGALVLGDASNQGFDSNGTLDVGAHTVTLDDADTATLGGLTQLGGGSLIAANGITLTGVLNGFGQVQATVNATGSSTLTALGGDLSVGDAAATDGVIALGGVGADPASTLTLLDSDSVPLGGDSTLNGGTVVAANGLTLLGSLSGSGQVQAQLSGAVGSSVTASGGTLTVGDATDSNGFSTDGLISTEAGAVLILQNADPVEINGNADLAGGTLSAPNGINLTGTISGHGTVTADLTNNGTIAGGPGTLRFEGAVSGTGSGFSGDTIEFAPGSSFTGTGTIAAKINGQNGSTITPTGSLALGDGTDPQGFVTGGSLDVGTHTVTLNDSVFAELDGGQATLDGGTIIAPNGLRLVNGAALSGNGTVQGPVDVAAGSTITPGGNLTLGDAARSDGFVTAGALAVGANTVTLNDANTAQLGGTTTLNGGALVAGNGVMLTSGGSLTGSGQVDATVNGEAGSSIVATGNLTLGDPSIFSGFLTRGSLGVGSHTVTLEDSNLARLLGDTTIDGGTLIAANGMRLQGSLTGSGQVQGHLSGSASSSIVATGGLTLGNGASSAGVAHAGSLEVGPHTVTLLDSTAASLGASTTLAGGQLISANGVSLSNNDNLSGHGSVQGRINAAAGSRITATGNLTLGDAASDIGFVSDGELFVESPANLTLLDASAAELRGVTVIDDGATIIAANGLELVAGSTTVIDDGSLNSPMVTVSGAMEVEGSSTIDGQATFNTTAAVTVNGDLSLPQQTTYNGGSYLGVGTIHQNGDATVESATTIGVTVYDMDGVSEDTNLTLNAPLTLNAGSIDPDNGRYDGTVTVNAGGQLTINSFVGWTLGGTASLNGGTIDGDALTNDGTIVGRGTVSSSGLVNNGFISAIDGELVLNPSQFLDLDGASNNGEVFATSSDVRVASNLEGLLNFAGTLNVIGAGRTFIMDFDGLENDGTMNLVGGGSYSAPQLIQRAALNVNETSLLSSASTLSTAAIFINGSVTTLTEDLIIEGSATVNVGAAMTGPGTLIVANGSTLGGNGTVGVGVENSGTVAGSGTGLTLAAAVTGTGGYTGTVRFADRFSPGASPAMVDAENLKFDTTATFEVEIGGLTPGVGYDTVNATGTVDLGGTLEINLINGFTPNFGDMFTILAAGEITNNFDMFTGDVFLLDDGPVALVPLIDPVDDVVRLVATGTGDVNGDGAVNFVDFIVMQGSFGGAGTWTTGDFNNDNEVNFVDFILFQASFGKTYFTSNLTTGLVAVPEPGSVVVVGLAAPLILRRRREGNRV